MTRRFILLALLVASALTRAHAAWPPDETAGKVDYKDPANWPNDPGYAKLWQYWSFVPDRIRNQVDERTKKLGTGAHYDRAWAKTTGDPRVIIAMTDSGMNWNEADLVNRLFLNAGELPVSMCPPADNARGHDVNGDGRFNVQDYTTAKGHELPAFTTVCDPRITKDWNANGILDPQDLIYTFSDTIDDDDNGYVDDISGWDFFHNDNDVEDSTDFGHGTGTSKDSAAEGGNERGEIGVCPDCSLVMLRVGDAFVPELNNWAMSVVYATDLGASVVNVSGGGGLSNPAFSRDAIKYAYDNNVTVVVSNSDLNSFHHNFPNTNNHAIAVHAIVHDQNKWESSTTFFNYNACTNYGGHLHLSVPANGCSSEASGRSGGLIGLLYSAALAADVPPPRLTAGDPQGNRRLTAEEVRQLLFTTTDSFYDPNDATDPTKFPTKPGFARRFGYGRPNPRTAIDALLAGKIPAEVDIVRPFWFDTLYPDKTPQVSIEGRVQVRGLEQNPPGTTFDYVVEWAPGVDPDEGQWQKIGQAEMVSSAVVGELARWDISALEVNNPVPAPTDPSFQPDDPVNVHTVTVRVRVTLHSATNPALEGVKSESRKAFHIYRDPDLLPGFPKFVGSSGESSPKLADLAGDGTRVIVLAEASGHVHAYRADGSELPGWPVAVEKLPHLDPMGHMGQSHHTAPGFKVLSPDRHAHIAASPAIGDIDGDGKPEVVIATWYGYVWAFKADGSVAPGFPVEVDRDSKAVAKDEDHELEDGFFASPVLVDLDRDGVYDIVAAGMDAKLYAWKGSGERLAGFPVTIADPTLPDDPEAPTPRQRQRIMTTPAAGDLNKDGTPDLVVGSNENYSNNGRLYAVDGRGLAAPGGPFLPGWPVSIVSTRFLPVVAQGVPIAAAMADVDKDGTPEVIISGLASVPKIFDAAGKPFGPALVNQRERYGEAANALNSVLFTFVSYPSAGDLDDDGEVDIVEGAAGTDAALAFAAGGLRRDFEHHMGAWDAKTGRFKRGFPRVMEDWQFFSTPALADVDDDGRVNILAGSGGYFIHGWDVDGNEAKGYPKFTGGWVLATPAVGDLDGDGKLELVVSTRNGYLYAWRTQGSAKGRVDWASFHHDNQNTGNAMTELDVGRRASPGGCAMAGAGGAPLGALLLGCVVLALALRRRAR